MIRIQYNEAIRGFVASVESFDQSKWLGENGGFYFYGRRSDPKIAAKMQAAGIPLNTRWLPKGNAASLLPIFGVEGVEFDDTTAEILTTLRNAVDESWTDSGTLDIPAPDGLSYRPYQRAGVDFAIQAGGAKRRGVMIGDEMGLGKTMQAIGYMAITKPNTTMIACPASLRVNWRNELTKWLPNVSVRIIDTAGDAEAAYDNDDGPVVMIVNYDKIVGKGARAVDLRDVLLGFEYDLLVCDEAHLLKNDEAQRTKVFLGDYDRKGNHDDGIVDNAKFAILLTGTPIQNKVREVVPLLRAIGAFGDHDGAISKSVGSFLYRYCAPQETKWGKTFDGASNLPELQRKLRGGRWLIRRLKADVAKELPPKLRAVMAIPCPPVDGFEDFDGADFVLRDGDTFEAAVRTLRGKTASFEELSAYRAALAEAKIGPVLSYLNDTDEGEKRLVFYHHKALGDALEREIGNCIRIDGSVAPETRQALVDRFQTDPTINYAFLSTHAAGVGLTLTAASTVVFTEADWNPSWCVQAEDRAHRIGQTADSVSVTYLVADGTLDARVVAVMVNKMDIADRALDRETAAPSVPVPVAPPPAPVADPSSPVTITIGKGRTEETVTLTRDQISAVGEGLTYLASLCDGAREQDDEGFNGRDAPYRYVHGQRVVSNDFVASLLKSADRLSPKQAAWGRRILTTYRKTQLPADLAARIWPE